MKKIEIEGEKIVMRINIILKPRCRTSYFVLQITKHSGGRFSSGGPIARVSLNIINNAKAQRLTEM